MSLLEVITKASTTARSFTSISDYPITLNPDHVLVNLKPRNEDSDNMCSLVRRAEGFQISDTDSQVIKSGKKFFKNLNRKLKNTNSFNKREFTEIFNSYLVENGDKIGISIDLDKSDDGYTVKLIEKLGFLICRDVLGLILEASIVLELWEIVECLIVNGLVGHSSSSNLVFNLIKKRRSNLVCLCVKHLSDLQASDILYILKYFLVPPKDGYSSMLSTRKEWENQALIAIKKVSDKGVGAKQVSLAQEAAVLLMIAHDGFTVSELCLHYLLASSNLDEVIFTSCISKLTGTEIMSLIRYLEKWLKKYDRFPQACPCPEASSSLGLKACKWVPTLDAIVKCYGFVIDEHFSSLVLDHEFYAELTSIDKVVNSLATEARYCCTLANLADNL